MASKAQMHSTAGQRRIPQIDKLHKKEELPIGRDKFIRTIKRLDLDKYRTIDVPESEEAEDIPQWRTDQADVENYLLALYNFSYD